MKQRRYLLWVLSLLVAYLVGVWNDDESGTIKKLIADNAKLLADMDKRVESICKDEKRLAIRTGNINNRLIQRLDKAGVPVYTLVMEGTFK